MVDVAAIKEHMEVVGSDGGHVGTVDHMDGQRIQLTKNDVAAGGQHHYLHIDTVDAVADGKVVLNRTTAQAQDEWGVKEIL